VRAPPSCEIAPSIRKPPLSRLEDTGEDGVSLRCARPACPESLLAKPPPHVPQHQHGDHHVVEWAEDGHELGDEVDGIEQPRQQANQGQPNPQRSGPISDQIAHQSEDIGHHPDKLGQPRVLWLERPQERDESHPDEQQAQDDPAAKRPFHSQRVGPRYPDARFVAGRNRERCGRMGNPRRSGTRCGKTILSGGIGTIVSAGGSYVGMDIDVVSVTERPAEASSGVSEAGFTALVTEHHGDLVRLAYAIVGNPDNANDVAQSAWAAAWRNRHRLREPSKVRGWLLTIAANEARRSLRRRRLRQFIPLVDDSGPTVVARIPEDQIDLIQAFQRLRPRDREILARRYALGETSQEIAEQVGMSDSGVRVRIGRLLRMLREELLK
jgi:RNA polymerase sigma-70 factor (ECF subfamily)